MNFPIPSVVISSILGNYGPLANVAANWPLVESALDAAAIYSPLCAVAAIATISVETARFSPASEGGGETYLTDLYERRVDLGNNQPGDGARFRGRGFVQIVGRRAYERFGPKIGRDLVANPHAALDPPVAAAILAAYFQERGVDASADQQNWEMVRRRVKGSLTEWTRFIDVATTLVSALKNLPPRAPGASQRAIEERDQ